MPVHHPPGCSLVTQLPDVGHPVVCGELPFIDDPPFGPFTDLRDVHAEDPCQGREPVRQRVGRIEGVAGAGPVAVLVSEGAVSFSGCVTGGGAVRPGEVAGVASGEGCSDGERGGAGEFPDLGMREGSIGGGRGNHRQVPGQNGRILVGHALHDGEQPHPGR